MRLPPVTGIVPIIPNPQSASAVRFVLCLCLHTSFIHVFPRKFVICHRISFFGGGGGGVHGNPLKKFTGPVQF